MSAPHYALYGTVTDSIVGGVERIRLSLLERFPGLIEIAKEPAHFTIVYGPALAADAKEALTFNAADDIYPEAASWSLNSTWTFYRGVARFVRPPKTYLHLEFENTELTRLQTTIRSRLPDVDAEYAARHKITSAFDQSNAPHPRRWLHIAIGTVPDSTSPADFLRMEDAVRDLADAFIPSQLAIQSLDLISAVTDTPVTLCE